jgi:hypothetical protein
VVQFAREAWTDPFVEDLLDLAHPVSAGRVQQDQVPTAQSADDLEQVVQVEVAVSLGPVAIRGPKERTL